MHVLAKIHVQPYQNLISVGQICKRLGYWLFLRGHDVYMPPKMREMLQTGGIPTGFEGFIRWRTDKNSPIGGTYDLVPVFWNPQRRLWDVRYSYLGQGWHLGMWTMWTTRSTWIFGAGWKMVHIWSTWWSTCHNPTHKRSTCLQNSKCQP
eukprot:SAG25_NODE_228_length_11469_cov_7.729903_2_plen_150_part_00